MNTLPRSSFSFRRQGSSGRIWQDQIQFVEPKANGSASIATSLGKNKSIKEENVSHLEETIMGRRLHDNSKRATRSSSSSKIHNKVHRGFFSSIFGRCMSSPASRDWLDLLFPIQQIRVFFVSYYWVFMLCKYGLRSIFNEHFFVILSTFHVLQWSYCCYMLMFLAITNVQ